MTATNKAKCVLLVDDDPVSLWLQKEVMRLYDDEVSHTHEASNGEEALEFILQYCDDQVIRFPEHCPDLILLDLNMPVMDGFAFLEAFQKIDSRYKDSMRVVVLTSSNNPDDKKKLEPYPVEKYVNKPLTSEKLEAILGS